MKKKVILNILGRVQGVFYRVNAKEKAQELNLKGRIRNMPNGSVQIVAEGEKNNLETLIKWCYNGPSHANVEKIEQTWQNFSGKFNDFEIVF